MVKLFKSLIKIIVYFILTIISSFAIFGSTIFKYSLQETIKFTTAAKFKIASVEWKILDPFKISLRSISYQKQTLRLTIKESHLKLVIGFDSREFKLIPNLDVTIEGVKVSYKTLENETLANEIVDTNTVTRGKESNKPIANLGSLLLPYKIVKDLKLRLKVNSGKGTLEIPNKLQYQVNNLFLDISIDSMFAPITWNISSELKIPFANLETVPFKAKGKVLLNNAHVEVDNAVVSVLDLPTAVTLNYGLAEDSLSIKTSTLINDLAVIPLQNQSIPIVKWNGKLALSTSLIKKNKQSELEGDLQFKLENGRFLLDYKSVDLKLSGLAKAEMQGKIPFVGKQLGSSELNWNLDFSELDILHKNLVHKEKAIELKSSGNLKYNKSIIIEEAKLKLHNLLVNLAGYINEEANSELKFNLPQSDLKGLEKVILPLAQQPLLGKLQLAGEVNGNLSQPAALNIKIESIKAKDISGYINYFNDKFLLRGPVSLNLDAGLIINTGNLQSGKFIANLYGSDLEIKYSDLYVKPKGAQLSLNVEARKNNDRLSIKDARLVTTAGVLSLTGIIPLPPYFEMNLRLQVPNWDIALMKSWLPKFNVNIPSGIVKSKLNFNGKINISDPFKSDITTTGDLSIRIPSYELVASDKPEEKLDVNGKLKLPKAFLPNLDIIKNMNLNLVLVLDLLKWKNLAIQQIQVLGNIANNSFIGQAAIQKIFSGQVKINRLEVPLLVEDPLVQFDISTLLIDADIGLATFLPHWKGVLSGKSNIKISGGSKLPNSPHFLEELRVDGSLLFNDGTLSTLPIVNMVQKRFAQYVGLKDKVRMVNSSDTKMKIATQFLFENKRIQLSDFEMTDVNQNLIQLIGKIDLNLDLDLKGKLFFMNSPIGGSFYEANKDARNRLVVPLNIKGSAKSPNLHMFDDTLKLMISNTIIYEKQKNYRSIAASLDKQSDQIRHEAEDQFKQQKKNIEVEMQKRLEGLVK